MQLKSLSLNSIISFICFYFISYLANYFLWPTLLPMSILSLLFKAFIFFGITLFVVNAFLSGTRINTFVFWAFLLYLFSVFSTLFNFNTQVSILSSLASQSFWFASFSFFYFSLKTNEDFKLDFIIKILFSVCLIFSLMFVVWKFSDSIYLFSISINAIYYPVFLLPIFFLLKNPLAKAIIGSVTFFAVFISEKRTAILALVLSLFIPQIFSVVRKKSPDRIKKIIGLLVLGVLLIVLYNVIYGNFDIDILSRFESIEEDRGSNRLDIYAKVFSEIKELNFFDMLLGKGFNGVFLASSLSTSAHNDFLEVFYDFGIVGFFCYIVFIIKIISFNIPLFRSNSPFALSYLSSTIIFLVFSVTSHVILYPTYFFYILFFWSIAIVYYEKQINDNSEVKTIENRNCNLS